MQWYSRALHAKSFSHGSNTVTERRQKLLRLEDLCREKRSAINESNTVGRLAETDSDDSEGYSENKSAASVSFNKTPRSHHSSTRTGTPALILQNIMHRPKLVAIETRLKMTNAQEAACTRGHSSQRLVKTHSQILPLISPVVDLQGTLRQHTELSDVFPSCSHYTETQST